MKVSMAFSMDNMATDKVFSSGVIFPLLAFIRLSHKENANETVSLACVSNFDVRTTTVFSIITPNGNHQPPASAGTKTEATFTEVAG